MDVDQAVEDLHKAHPSLARAPLVKARRQHVFQALAPAILHLDADVVVAARGERGALARGTGRGGRREQVVPVFVVLEGRIGLAHRSRRGRVITARRGRKERGREGSEPLKTHADVIK